MDHSIEVAFKKISDGVPDPLSEADWEHMAHGLSESARWRLFAHREAYFRLFRSAESALHDATNDWDKGVVQSTTCDELYLAIRAANQRA